MSIYKRGKYYLRFYFQRQACSAEHSPSGLQVIRQLEAAFRTVLAKGEMVSSSGAAAAAEGPLLNHSCAGDRRSSMRTKAPKP